MSYIQLSVKEEIAKLIRTRCKEEYLSHHPEMREIYISDNKILYEMARFYLESR